jgi:hypothetical protein
MVFIITDKAKSSRGGVKGVGVMKDEELKLEEIETSHTLGGYGKVQMLFCQIHYSHYVSQNLMTQGQRFGCEKNS